VKGKQITYMELLPLDAYNQEPRRAEETHGSSGLTFTTYKTNNPGVFWARPDNAK